MEVQYICDEDGRQTGVIDPSKYRGMYKDLLVDVKKESAILRDEWTRA